MPEPNDVGRPRELWARRHACSARSAMPASMWSRWGTSRVPSTGWRTWCSDARCRRVGVDRSMSVSTSVTNPVGDSDRRAAHTDLVGHGSERVRQGVRVVPHENVGAVAEDVGRRPDLTPLRASVDLDQGRSICTVRASHRPEDQRVRAARCGVGRTARPSRSARPIDDRRSIEEGPPPVLGPRRDVTSRSASRHRGMPTRSAGLRRAVPSATASASAARSTVRKMLMLRRRTDRRRRDPSSQRATSSRVKAIDWDRAEPGRMCPAAHSYCAGLAETSTWQAAQSSTRRADRLASTADVARSVNADAARCAERRDSYVPNWRGGACRSRCRCRRPARPTCRAAVERWDDRSASRPWRLPLIHL